MTDDSSAPAVEARGRGQGFPALPLQDSVNAVVTAGLNGPDHSRDAFATYLGHRTPNSGAFRGKLARLRDFGLIVKRGDPDRVVLSKLAQRLVLAHPDHYEDKRLLLEAFESCRVFGVLHTDSAKNVAMDISRLRAQVLMRLGVANDQVDRFVDSFVKSAVFAGLAQSDGTKVTLLPREAALSAPSGVEEAGSMEEGSKRDHDEAHEPIPPMMTSTREPSSSATPPVPVALRQEWPVEGGSIEFVIRTPKAMPPAIYGLMAKMAEVAAAMEALLSPEGTEPATPAAEVSSGTESPRPHHN